VASGDWNFLAGRLDGDGFIEIIETELPINVTSISRTLSAPSGMDGTITNAVRRLKNNGRPVFEPWNTVLIAEAAGLIRGMSLYLKPSFNGPAWELDQIGLSGYPQGMPYDGEASFLATDPLDIFRHIWDHLQGWPAGNIGVTIDRSVHSPVRVGTPPQEGDNDSGPRKLNWWETTNLGGVIDDLAKETPFDWVERVYWDGDQPHCHIDLGYPIIGTRKDQYRLVLGENLATVPGVTEADYYNGVLAVGAGEGRDRVRGWAGVADGRIRRVRSVDDKNLADAAQATARARAELNTTRGHVLVDTVTVFDHPNAPLEAIELGDELPLYAETDHIDVDAYVRVVGKDEAPQTSDQAVLTVVRQVQA
jgi:hypothetical protein